MAGESEARMNQPAPPSRSAEPSPAESSQPGPERHASVTRATGDSDTELHLVRDAALSDDAVHELSSTRVIGEGGMLAEPAPPSAGEAAAAENKKILVGGDFQLLKKLGEGAMGVVYRARQLSFNRDVAIKVLFPRIAKNQKLVERLYREARAMNLLDHPNIVHSYACGEEHGCPYVAMEFVEGDNLQKWLSRLGRLSVADAVYIILACARGLAYAHKQGMIHRDIKPENILVARDGTVKIADLGMVKAQDDDMALTQTGHAVGTPWYMPLEQAKNAKETDGRCDIYALGCTFYCLLTGNPPFTGTTIIDVIRAKEQGTFRPARSVNSEVPERLDLVIAKMTAKLPQYRYASCEELIADLDALGLGGRSLQLDEPTPTPEPRKRDQPSGEIVTNPTLAGALPDPHIWYVRFKGPGGQAALRKYTTAQLQKKLADGTIEPKAKASHNPRDGFRALATYKELEGKALSRASKEAADKNTARYRNLYKKIEEQERQREEQEQRRSGGLPAWIGLAVTVLAIAVGVGLLAWFIYYISGMLR
jgi:serine/threonine protein kinase